MLTEKKRERLEKDLRAARKGTVKVTVLGDCPVHFQLLGVRRVRDDALIVIDAAWRYSLGEECFFIDEWNPVEMTGEDCQTRLPFNKVQEMLLSKKPGSRAFVRWYAKDSVFRRAVVC